MRILAVDDEPLALGTLERAIREVVPDCALAGFTSPKEALAHAKNSRPDIAFLDVSMPNMSGLSLAKALKDIHGRTNIIFVTGYSEYTLDAFGLRASGYILKPVEPEAILCELEHLRHPVEPGESRRVRVQCFGNFGVFLDGDSLMFSRAKPKELLAYLVHKRGTAVKTAEIAAVLWEDKAYTHSVLSNTQNVISHLMKTLRDAGVEDIVQKGWNSMAIDREKISCDYYDSLNGDVDSLNSYTGEYMNNYSWAEFVIGYLDDKIK